MKKLILAIAIFLGASPLWAELMTYQGRLKESDVPVTGNRLFTFEFCDAEDGSGLCLIAPGTPASFAVANGLFKSTITIHPNVDLAVGAWYLRVTVGSSVLTPLERLTAVPYSVFASSAGYASYAAGAVQKAGDTMTGQLTLDGSTLTVTGNEFSVGGSTFVVKNGYVGIGTSSPNNPLQVHTSGLYVFTGSATGASAVLNVVPQTGGTVMLNNNASGSVALAVGHIKHLLVDKTGNVGISSVTPSYRLVVSSGAGETGTIMAVSTGTSNLFWVAGDGAHATKFYGDGSGLSGVTGATDNTKVLKTGDTMTGPLAVMVDPAVNSFDIQTNGITISTSGAITTAGLGLGSATANTRGRGAIDLQTDRVNSNESATGDYSVLSGGRANKSPGNFSVTGGGQNNSAYGASSTLLGGENNTVTGNYSFVGGGVNNSLPAYASVVAGGQNNKIDAASNYSAVLGGSFNEVAANFSAVGGGQYNVLSGSNSVIAGGVYNVVTGTSATVGGGEGNKASEYFAAVGGGNFNEAKGAISYVGGGRGNTASALKAVVGGGLNNEAGGIGSVVAGGDSNQVLDQGGTISGGDTNILNSGAVSAVIGGGSANQSSDSFAVIGGGYANKAGQLAVVGGGQTNIASGTYSSVGGGRDNVATGQYAAVPGGYNNTAEGNYSYAAGAKSSSTAQGAFTWQDSGGATINLVNGVTDRTVFKNRGGFIVTGSTNTSMTGTLDRGVIVTGNGLLGVATSVPQAALDVVSTGTAANVYAQIWRDANGTVVASMTAAGAFTSLQPLDGDDLGDHNAYQDLQLNWNNIYTVSTITAAGNITAARYQINGSTVLAMLPGLSSLAVGPEAGRVNTGAYNVFVGSAAGRGNASGTNNAMVGFMAGYTNDGSGNTFIGSTAGSANTAGSQNIVIGYSQQTSAAGASSELNIGGLIFGQIGAKTVGISTRTPQAALDIVSTGTGAGYFAQIWRDSTGLVVSSVSSQGIYYGNGSGLTGVTAAGAVQKAGDTMTGALNLNGNFLAGVSTITMQGGSIAIVPPGTGGSNNLYGIAIGSNAYNNYSGGVGVGRDSYGNYTYGVGVGAATYNNNTYGVGVGSNAAGNYNSGVGLGRDSYNNYDHGTGLGAGANENRIYGVGVGFNAGSNFNYGVGIGAFASGNDAYAVGVGAYSQNNAGYGAALGAYSYASSSATALGAQAKANAERSLALGYGTVNNSTGTASFGNYAVYTSTAVNAAYYQVNGSTVLALRSGSLAVGAGAGRQNTGLENVFVGTQAGESTQAGDYNVFLGYQAGLSNTFGYENSFLGDRAGRSNTTGQDNTLVGALAGSLNQTGSANAAFGYSAGYGVASNSFSSATLVGYKAGTALTTGSDNILVGFQAGDSITTGGRNIVIGYDQDTSVPGAGNELNIGGVIFGSLNERAIGISTRAPQAALDVVSTGTGAGFYAQIWRDSTGVVVSSVSSQGIYYGNGSGLTGVTAAGAVQKAGDTMTGALNMNGNFLAGVSTITMQSGSLAIVPPGTGGSNTGYGISIGSNSYDNYTGGVGIGYNSYANYAYGVGIGYNANNNSSQSVAIGKDAFSNVNYSVAIGPGASSNQAYGVGIGANASANKTSGVGLGRNASGNTDYAVGIGAYSQNNKGYGAALGAYSYASSSATALGAQAKANAERSLALGYGTVNNSTGTASFGGYGVNAAYYQVSGSTILAMLPGVASLGVGVEAGRVNTATQNTFVGVQAGYDNTTGAGNSFLGYRSGYANTTGSNNSFLGKSVAYSNTTGSNNTFLGFETGLSNITGSNNSYLGHSAGYNNQAGSANAAFGSGAGRGVSGQSYSSSTLVGYQAGYNLNSSVGNILIGYKAGYSITTGTGNIVIGYEEDVYVPTDNNVLNIGGVLFGELQDKTIGINSFLPPTPVKPQAALDIVSTGTASNVYAQIWRNSLGAAVSSVTAQGVFYGNGSGLTGITASDATKLPLAGGNMTGQLTTASTVTVQGGAFSVGTSTFVVNAGRVGINWITPEAALQVSGGAKFLSNAGTSYILTAGSAARPDMFFVSSGGAVGMGDFTGVSVDTASAVQISSRLIGATNGSEDVRVGLFVESNTDGTLDSADLLVSGNFEATVRGADAPSLVSPLRLKVRRENAPTGTVDRAIGLFIDDLQNEAGGTINNTYGIFIGDQSSGSQNNTPFALFSVDPNARSYFAGSVGIARTAPAARLDLAAAGLGADSMGQIWRNFDGTVVSSVSATGVMMAAKFIGDGSGLTGLSGVQKTGDTMTGALTMSGSSITIRNSSGNEGLELRDPTGNVIPELRLARDGASYWDIGGAGGGTPLVFQYGGINRMFLASDGHLTLNDSGQVVSRLHLRPAVIDSYSLFISSADGSTPALTVRPGGQLYTAGRVGIGSAAPTEALDISGRVLISTRAGGNEVTDGLISNGAGGIEFYSGGTKYMKVQNGGGYIGIGPGANVNSNTMSPKLQVKGSMSVGSTYGTYQPPANSLVVEGRLGAGTAAPDAALSVVQSDVAGSSYTVHIGTSSTAYHLVVTTAGWMGLNTQKPQAPLHLTAATKDEGIIVEHNSSTSEGSYLALLKARGSASMQSLVAEGDNLGVLAFGGYNGTSGDPFPMAAAIVGRVDGAPTLSAPDMPGRLEFMTAADDTNETVTRMVIRNDGGVGIATGTPQAMLDIRSTSTLAQIWRDASGVARATMTADGTLYAMVGSAVQKAGDNMTGALSITPNPAVYIYDLLTNGIQISTAGSITTIGAGNGISGAGVRGLGAVDLQTARTISAQVAQGAFSTLSGGVYNTVLGSNTVVAGGRFNVAAGTSSVISGGESNYTYALYSTVGGGRGNTANMDGAGVFSGQTNIAEGLAAFVGGGRGNTVEFNYGAIAGGMNNTVGAAADYGFVGGGYQNTADGTHSAVTGGWNNTANGLDAFVGAGYMNVANGEKSVVGGGTFNTTDAQYGVITGGYENKMQAGSIGAFIGGGKNNAIDPGMEYSAIVGGSSNTVSGMHSFIGGGGPVNPGDPGNKVLSDNSVIVGGGRNLASTDSWLSFIGGGSDNKVRAQLSVVVGGNANIAGTAPASMYAGVVSGWENRAVGDASFVGGGAMNTASGSYATVPGGYQNTAKGNYSFAAGYKSSSTAAGTFTWADSVGAEILNSVANQVMFKAAGGFWVSTGTVYSDPALYVTNTNRVGIGITAPIAKLDVRSDTGNTISGMSPSGNGTDGAIYGWTTGAATAIKGVANGTGYAGRFEGKVFITDDGVNPANPAKLQVKGDLGLGNGLQDGNTPIVIWLTASTPFVDGDVVVVSGNYQFGTTTAASSSAVLGVAQGAGASSSTGKIAVGGVVIANCLNGTAGQHAVTSATTGQVQGVGSPTSGTSVGRFLTNCGNPVVNRAVLLLK